MKRLWKYMDEKMKAIMERTKMKRHVLWVTATLCFVLATAAFAAEIPADFTKPKWPTLVPNGMLDFLNRDIASPWNISSPLNWTNETDRARAIWATDGVDGDDRCLAIDAEIGGKGKWISAPFTVEGDTEYAFSVLFRYDNEDGERSAYVRGVDVNSNGNLFNRALPRFTSWQRVRGLFRTDKAAEVRVELVKEGTGTTWFDEVMMLPSDVAVHPQLPEDGAVMNTMRPALAWWHKNGGQGKYTVLIGRDPWITKEVRRYEVTGAMTFVSPGKLPEGTWFWVVLPETKERINEYIHKSISEIRSFAITADRGKTADTTPPHLYRMRPALDSTAETNSPVISLKWLERGGSGMDESSVRMLIDGKTPAQQPSIKKDGLELLVAGLENGRHRVSVEVADQAGNRSEAIWQFYVGERAPSIAKLDKNGWILFNDLYFFPISHYDFPLRETNMERDSDYVDAGFNLIINCFNFDNALKWGVKGIQTTGGNAKGKSEDELAKRFSEVKWGLDHPAYLGRWMDEQWKPAETWPIFKAFRRVDEHHLMMPNASGPWQIAHHPKALIDIPTLDFYPIGSYCVTELIMYFQQLEKIRLPGQGMHYWAQAFDWTVFYEGPKQYGYGVDAVHFDFQKQIVGNPKLAGHVYRPTQREMFALTALGWVVGVQNAGWWGPPASSIPDVREGIKENGRRSSWLAQILRGNPPEKRTTVDSSSASRVWIPNKYALVHIAEREYAGKRYLIAVNVNSAPAKAIFHVPELADGVLVKALWEDRMLGSSNGIFQDVIPGIGAVIYEY